MEDYQYGSIVSFTVNGEKFNLECHIPKEPTPDDIAILIRNHAEPGTYVLPDVLRSATKTEVALAFFRLNKIENIEVSAINDGE